MVDPSPHENRNAPETAGGYGDAVIHPHFQPPLFFLYFGLYGQIIMNSSHLCSFLIFGLATSLL